MQDSPPPMKYLIPLLPRRASLHAKLMVALLLAVSLVAGSLAWWLIVQDSQRRLAALEMQAAQLATLYSRSLSMPMWNVDHAVIAEQIAALEEDPLVLHVQVMATG